MRRPLKRTLCQSWLGCWRKHSERSGWRNLEREWRVGWKGIFGIGVCGNALLWIGRGVGILEIFVSPSNSISGGTRGWMGRIIQKNGNAVTTQETVSISPTLMSNWGARKMRKAMQSRYEIWFNIMIAVYTWSESDMGNCKGWVGWVVGRNQWCSWCFSGSSICGDDRHGRFDEAHQVDDLVIDFMLSIQFRGTIKRVSPHLRRIVYYMSIARSLCSSESYFRRALRTGRSDGVRGLTERVLLTHVVMRWTTLWSQKWPSPQVSHLRGQLKHRWKKNRQQVIETITCGTR